MKNILVALLLVVGCNAVLAARHVTRPVMLITEVAASRSDDGFVTRDAGPLNHWIAKERTSGEEVIEVRVALRQHNLDKAEALALAVSDPTSPSYGEHLSVQELAALLQPPAAVVDAVTDWLVSGGAHTTPRLAATGDYLTVSFRSHVAEKLFRTELWHFHDSFPRKAAASSAAAPRRAIIRAHAAQGYKLPAALQEHVEMVLGLADYPPVVARPSQRVRSGARDAAGTAGAGKPIARVTPATIWAAYNLPKGQPTQHPSSQAVAEFEEEYFYPSDCNVAEKRWGIGQQNVTVIGVNSPVDGYLGEASLDVEYIIATVPGNPTSVFSHDVYDLVNWALNVTGQPDPPKVHSISYGSPEHVYTADLLSRTNTEFMKLGLLGLSVLTASGDSGPGAQGLFRCKHLATQFPASSPWVTAVGGTYIDDGTKAETGWESSGGGFSDTFPAAKWQQKQVAAYLAAEGLPDTGLYNRTGRALPDISAFAVNYEVCIEGFCSGTLSGTSASSPVMASMVTAINGARAAAGKKPLGFLNPWLYSLQTVGHDITSGVSKDWPCKGWPATAGWDAVTGLGTPDFQVLLGAATALP